MSSTPAYKTKQTGTKTHNWVWVPGRFVDMNNEVNKEE